MTSAKPEIKARPTLYKGIRMRSRLEADFAASLDAGNLAWEYEPDCYANPDGQWLPDFRITQGITRILVEIKPAGFPGLGEVGRVDGLLRQMAIAWDSDPLAWLDLEFRLYGKDGPRMRVLGIPGQPWLVWHSLHPQLWEGMGQQDAATRHAGHAAEFPIRAGRLCPGCQPVPPLAPRRAAR